MLRARIAFLLSLSLCATVPVASQQNAEAPDERISMDFDAIELRQALQFIIRSRAINLVTADPLDQTVTVKLNNVPWRMALDSVLKAHGYTSVEEEGILRIINRESESENARAVPIVLQLRHVSAETARRILEPLLSERGKLLVLGGENSRTFSVIDEPAALEMIQSLLPKIDIPTSLAIRELTHNEDGTIDIRLQDYPLADIDKVLKEDLDQNVFIQGALAGSVGINLQAVRWEDALKLILSRHGYTLRLENNVVVVGKITDFEEALLTQEYRLRYVDGWDLKPYLEKLLSSEGKITCFAPSLRGGFEFGTKVTERRQRRDQEDESSQTVSGRAKVLSVTDRPAVVDVISKRIATLDVKPKQVEVDVKIIEIRHSTGDFRGIDWNVMLSISGANRPTNLPFGPHSGKFFPDNFPDPATGFAFGSLSASQFTAVLRMIRSSTDAEVVSEPNITTLDNIEASILIGQKFPVTSETIDPQTAVRTVTLDYYEDIGIQLLVVPSISDDDRIHMVIHPAVSTVAGLIENRFPIIDTREADTQVFLASGDTAVIGGLVSRDVDRIERRVPFIGRIPFLGRLFRYNEDVKTSTELIIFVTPRIVRDGSDFDESTLMNPEREEALRELRDLFQRAEDR